jgi:hypothetical protein
MGPEFCSILPADASRDKVNRLSTFLQQLQPGTRVELALELAEDVVSRLPSSEVVRPAEGSHPNKQRSYGPWDDVWLPGYESSMALLPDFLKGSADLGKCSDEDHLCITIKRDWLESFWGPFSDNGEFATSTLETTAPVSQPSEFGISDSPIVTPYGQPGKEKGKQRVFGTWRICREAPFNTGRTLKGAFAYGWHWKRTRGFCEWVFCVLL